jgi:lysophospholipase L1-like esterase
MFKGAFAQAVLPAEAESFKMIQRQYNYIQYRKKGVFEQLYNRWTQVPFGRFRVAHFGDSHVQLDHFVSCVRNNLQQLKGDAGRGMVFPFAIAKSYSHTDYTSLFSGVWKSSNSIQTPPKIPVGITGFVATTDDTVASFKIIFKSKLQNGNKTIRFFCNRTAKGYLLEIKSSGEIHQLDFDTISDKKSPFIDFSFEHIGDTISVTLHKASVDQSRFEFYGMSIENSNEGIVYQNFGVGGANFSALLNQVYFEDQIQYISPDLIILDWGTNDILYTNFISETVLENIHEVIRRVKQKCPDAVILLTSVQDMNWKGKNITKSSEFSDQVRKIAFENDCLFYDWFSVSGGKNSMKQWEFNGFGRKDNIHLTQKGYQLKGALFTEAILNSINSFKVNGTTQVD